MQKRKRKSYTLNAFEAEALRLVEKGMRTGVRKFGNFNPNRDKRNMLDEAIEEARDQLVYLMFLRGTLFGGRRK